MRHVVSLVERPPAVAHADPSLEPNAYAVAEDVDLVLVLRGAGVEHALVAADAPRVVLAGVPLSSPAESGDLRALVESGIPVLVPSSDLARAGLTETNLVAGIRVISDAELAETLRNADGVVSW